MTIPSKYTFNHKPHKDMPKHLMPVSRALKAAGFPVLFRYSSNHVPHLVLDIGDGISVCWFGKGQFFRVFSPYPRSVERHDTATPEGVVKRVQVLVAATEPGPGVRPYDELDWPYSPRMTPTRPHG